MDRERLLRRRRARYAPLRGGRRARNDSWAFIGIYVASALYVYNGRLIEGIFEIVRIPAIDYVLVFILAGIFWVIIKLMGLFKRSPDSLVSS